MQQRFDLGASAGGIFVDAGDDPLVAIEAGGRAIRIGCCGFSYAEWVGTFYPAGLKQRDMLAYYAERFDTLEIDSSYYGVPKPITFERLVALTPDDFRVTLKLPGTLTHVPPDDALHEDGGLIVDRARGLRDAGKLACWLAQFPASFRPGDSARDRLRRLREACDGVPLVVEFRHREWQTLETLAFLDEHDIGWTNVDEPNFDALLRPSSDVTGGIGYVRFHGRNAEQWWTPPTPGDRYRYEYSDAELEPWADRVLDMAGSARETYAFFNNHRYAQATVDARKLARLIRLRLGG